MSFNKYFIDMKRDAFTLIELIIVIVGISIVSGIGMRVMNNSGGFLSVSNKKYQSTVMELNEIKKAILGDATLVTDGVRLNFGYIGANGVFPANMAALISMFPAGMDYRHDAWGNLYDFNDDGTFVTITSYGEDGVSGGTGFDEDIVLKIRKAVYDSVDVRVNVYDMAGRILFGGIHIDRVRLIGGTTFVNNAANDGTFSFVAPIGEYTLEVRINASYRNALNNGNANYNVTVQVYPRASGVNGNAGIEYITVRLPGALD